MTEQFTPEGLKALRREGDSLLAKYDWLIFKARLGRNWTRVLELKRARAKAEAHYSLFCKDYSARLNGAQP